MDLYGLNSREIAFSIAKKNYDVDFVFQRRPEILILLSNKKCEYGPMLYHEGLIYRSALTRGYKITGAIEVPGAYNLLVLMDHENHKDEVYGGLFRDLYMKCDTEMSAQLEFQ